MRLLLLGGSFNPIHIGHLILAEEARCLLGYTHVMLVPAYMRPMKALQSDPGPEARLEMVREAVGDDPNLIVWDGEIRRGGASYTIDTIRELKRSFEIEGRPGLLLGDDLLAEFPRWRESEAIAREARLVCAHREHAECVPFPYEHVYLDNLLIPVSSQLVRDRVASGLPFRRLVPEPVWKTIKEKGYYRNE